MAGGDSDERQILGRISAMIDDERTLREARAAGTLDPETEHERLTQLETELDQCWDLLRQRRAKRESGQDPAEAHVRPGQQVEDYLS
jgi:chromosome condensin MukBEF complex kleisin-like MukF subunit